MRKKYLLLLILLILCFFLTSYFLKKKDVFFCEGEYIRNTNGINISGILRFEFFSENDGVVIFSGRVFHNNESSLIATKINFEYTVENNKYSLISKKINRSVSDDKFLLNENIFLFPDFYIKENEVFQLSIYKINPKAYIFYDVITPVLYCYERNA